MIYFKMAWLVFCNILAFYILLNTIYICFLSGVPAIPSSKRTLNELKKVIQKYAKRKNFVFVDLGCGTGRFLFMVAKIFPDAKFIGVEINPFITMFCKFKKFLFARKNVNFIRGNIFKVDIKAFNPDFIYLYLGEKISVDISEKLKKEVGKDVYIISNKFELSQLDLIDVVDYNNLINGPLRVYKNRR